MSPAVESMEREVSASTDSDTSTDSLRKAEVNAKHYYEMLRQNLEDQMAADTKE